jgi:hypothetical protein
VILLGAVFLWLCAALIALTVVWMWRTPIDSPIHTEPEGWPYGDKWWRAYRRTMVPGLLTILLGALAFTFPDLAPFFGLAILGAALPLTLSIALVNRPKTLVPPAERHERGLIGRRT